MTRRQTIATVLMLSSLVATTWAGGPLCYYPGDKQALENADGYKAVLLPAVTPAEGRPVPWVLEIGRPSHDIRHINTYLITNGVAVVAVDALKGYGSPETCSKLDALYADLVEKRGFAARPVILARDLNGLLAWRWAVANPDKIRGVACLTAAVDLANAGDTAAIAEAYGMTTEAFAEKLDALNPLNHLEPLVKAGVAVHVIHAEADNRVPIEPHARALEKRYKELGGTITLRTIEGSGVTALVGVPAQPSHHEERGVILDDALRDFLASHARQDVVGDQKESIQR